MNAMPISYRAASFRAIFDPLCAEWNCISMEEKMSILRQLMCKFSFETIVESYCASWENSAKKEYVLHEVPEAIYKLAEYLPEAAEYYNTSSRCQSHWRLALRRTLNDVQIIDFLNKASDIADSNLK